ncbi:hypothetical protein BH23GEM3_BH23GEM3_03610 [soil metagenome]
MQLHESAAEALARSADAVPAGRWFAGPAPGKWSPSEVVQHLILAYEVLLRDLNGGPGMAVRTSAWQRLLLRFVVRPRLLAGGAFRKGVPAPREVRPAEATEGQELAIARFRARAGEFQRALEAARAERPRTRLTHAYFGALSLEEALRFCARHIRHHQPQLSSPSDGE